MKVLVDENIPTSIVKLLISNGFEVLDIRNSEHEGKRDEFVFNYALERSAFFITTDKDFFHTIPWKFPEHFGVAIIALKQPNSESLMAKMIWLLANHNLYELKNKVILLRDHTYTIR